MTRIVGRAPQSDRIRPNPLGADPGRFLNLNTSAGAAYVTLWLRLRLRLGLRASAFPPTRSRNRSHKNDLLREACYFPARNRLGINNQIHR